MKVLSKEFQFVMSLKIDEAWHTLSAMLLYQLSYRRNYDDILI